MLFGEKIPDKNDPQYKERYERDVAAGRRFAKATRIDKGLRQRAPNAVSGARLHLRYRGVRLERLPSGGGVPAQPVTPHGDGDAGFGTAAAAQAVAGGRNEGG